MAHRYDWSLGIARQCSGLLEGLTQQASSVNAHVTGHADAITQ
jgi:hypothetical protein